MRRAIIVLAALAASSCASPDSELRGRVSPTEADAFEECRDAITARTCQHPDTGFYGDQVRFDCLAKLAGQYSAMPSTAERRSFLVEAGCPATVVNLALPTPR